MWMSLAEIAKDAKGKRDGFKISKGRKSDDGDQRSEKATGFRVGARNDGKCLTLGRAHREKPSCGFVFRRSVSNERVMRRG